MRRYLVAGNWKMHGDQHRSAALISKLQKGLPAAGDVDMVVLPPFVYLSLAAEQLAGGDIGLGAQDLCEQAEEGAVTGGVSASMLLDVGCRYVIVGHSERRQLYGEDDTVVARKTRTALQAGLTPILCVGESAEQREAGQVKEVIARQLMTVLEAVGDSTFSGAVIAYEPVWAIGTGNTATPEQAQNVHAAIRGLLAGRNKALAQTTRLLYGGSVKADNAAALFAQPDIDGGLVGGASLDADEFTAIYRAAM